ncbi:MAG: DNA double-strand break repair nuclease NurA [Candidatus Nanoarchaeia archaeon]|nr:DNA double-strand break repair nuclease NurA [Candidatus Nanoarchaeia archaeon]
MFTKTLKEMDKLNIKLPTNPSIQDLDFSQFLYPTQGELISKIEDSKIYKLDPKRGSKFINENLLISAYDESINKFSCLEGTAFLTSHSLVIQKPGEEYLPANYLTFYFYTRSKDYSENADYIKYSEDPEADSKRDYVQDRTEFILQNTPKNSIILIDGPLIGAQASSYTIKLNKELLKKDILPIFFVKNSNSNIVIDNIKELKGRYNSDMHWSYNILKPGERTCLFRYEDKFNPNNAKLFCYLKTFNISPQRIEFHVDTFNKYKNQINDMMDLICYLVLAQGDLKNPQTRPIAIAEMYARETLKLIDLDKLMRGFNITPTMNQERFGW